MIHVTWWSIVSSSSESNWLSLKLVEITKSIDFKFTRFVSVIKRVSKLISIYRSSNPFFALFRLRHLLELTRQYLQKTQLEILEKQDEWRRRRKLARLAQRFFARLVLGNWNVQKNRQKNRRRRQNLRSNDEGLFLVKINVSI